MPLDKSGSKASVGKNIKTEMAAGRPQKQAIAIALSTQRRAKGLADGGVVGLHHGIERTHQKFAEDMGTHYMVHGPKGSFKIAKNGLSKSTGVNSKPNCAAPVVG